MHALWSWWSPVLQGALMYALPITATARVLGKWIERVTDRRHQERMTVLRSTHENGA